MYETRTQTRFATAALTLAAVGVLVKRGLRYTPMVSVGAFYAAVGRYAERTGTSWEVAGEHVRMSIVDGVTAWALAHPQAFLWVMAAATLYYIARQWSRIETAVLTFMELPFRKQVRITIVTAIGGGVIGAIEWYTRYQVVQI